MAVAIMSRACWRGWVLDLVSSRARAGRSREVAEMSFLAASMILSLAAGG